MTAGFRELAFEERMERFIRKFSGKALRPGKLDNLRSEVEGGEPNVLRIICQRAQTEDIGTGSRRSAELRMGMSEELLLRAHEASTQNFIGKLHLMGGFVVDLLAEKIGHGGRIFVQVDALRPAAVDVVHEPLEGPKTTEKFKALIVGELTVARRIRHCVHGRN